MSGSLDGRLPGWVQRKAEKYQALNAGQWTLRGCRRGHPPAQRFAPCDQRKVRRRLGGRLYSGSDRSREDCRRIGSATALLHVGELVAEGCDRLAREFLGNRTHEGMMHARPRAVAQHQQPACVRRAKQNG